MEKQEISPPVSPPSSNSSYDSTVEDQIPTPHEVTNYRTFNDSGDSLDPPISSQDKKTDCEQSSSPSEEDGSNGDREEDASNGDPEKDGRNGDPEEQSENLKRKSKQRFRKALADVTNKRQPMGQSQGTEDHGLSRMFLVFGISELDGLEIAVFCIVLSPWGYMVGIRIKRGGVRG